ncbi:MAG: hypothetical protein ACI9K2_003797 [Myxococcota bacterium]|jgi:hypothetical protein
MTVALAHPEHAVLAPSAPLTLARLAAGAAGGLGAFGASLHAPEGALAMLGGAGTLVLAAGLAWTVAVPALVVTGALLGSTLDVPRTVHGSLVAVHWGGVAFLASVPVVLLAQLVTHPTVAHAVGWGALLGVGACTALIFARAMHALEGTRALHLAWMGLFGTLFLELAWLAGAL